MELKIWLCDCVNNDDPADQLYLSLVEKKGGIYLIAVDKAGKIIKDGNILVLDNELKVITSLCGISDDIPLKTDIENRPLIVKDTEIDELINRAKKDFFMKELRGKIEFSEKEHSTEH